MPKYFYKCSICNEEQSFSHGFDDIKTDCIICGEKNSLKKIIKKFSLDKINKEQSVGSVVKASIEEFRQDLSEEKKALQEKIYE